MKYVYLIMVQEQYEASRVEKIYSSLEGARKCLQSFFKFDLTDGSAPEWINKDKYVSTKFTKSWTWVERRVVLK